MRITRILTGTAAVTAAVLFSAPAANAADSGTPNKAHTQLGGIDLKTHYKGLLDFMDLHTNGTLEATGDKEEVIGGTGADG
ncbi:hypothetical protein ACFVT1_40295 [Streptomyces sp. NPDC057963]|uniref:hypothetical protein n=1 Tax=Streptomyces sp. NPDC057963 TaxID=3346290 RepID=UPI0036F129FA